MCHLVKLKPSGKFYMVPLVEFEPLEGFYIKCAMLHKLKPQTKMKKINIFMHTGITKNNKQKTVFAVTINNKKNLLHIV